MTKVNFTDWLHTELDAVFHGDITPKQVIINATPMIDAMFSQNNGNPIVSLSLPTPDWRSFRVKYYKECTMRDSVDGRKVRIDFTPHDLFEWFKKELTACGNAS